MSTEYLYEFGRDRWEDFALLKRISRISPSLSEIKLETKHMEVN